MFRLFFKTAYRNLLNDKNNNILNIVGLVAGIIAFIYIVVYVFGEYSFDKFHKDSENIYRCCTDVKFPGMDSKMADSNDPLAPAIRENLPDAESTTRVYYKYSYVVANHSNSFIEDQVLFADSNFFEMFDFDLITGNKRTALNGPNKLVLTEKAALKYFGDKSPIGKTLNMGENKTSYEITGILQKIPKNSHLQFEILGSYSTLTESRYGNWGNFDGTYTYVKLKPDVNQKAFESNMNTMVLPYFAQIMEDGLGISMEEFEAQGNHITAFLQPLADIHLNTDLDNDTRTKGSYRMLHILELTGILILIIACINFINISTAKSTNRAREIGLKKICGSLRLGLFFQIISESFIYSLISVLLAITFFILLLPIINSYTGLIIEPNDLLNRWTISILIFLPIILSILAGGYPALIITRLKPLNIIKTKSLSGNAGKWARGSLVSFQFIIFLLLVLSAITIKKQILFVRNHDTGFQKDNLVIINNTIQLGDHKENFKNEILKNSGVIIASFNQFFTGGGNPFGPAKTNETIMMSRMKADKYFQNTFKIEMADGEFFSKNASSEKNNVVISTTAAKMLGWNNCQDKYLHDYNEDKDLKVIGIVKDFERSSFKLNPTPLAILPGDNSGDLIVKISGQNMSQTISQLEDVWKTFDETTPFQYEFVDSKLNSFFKAEEQLSRIMSASTLFAIVIACLGLFGLVSYASNKRQKEIGIRKVNGAKIYEVLGLLNKDILIWVLLATIIACPLARIFLKNWLENYAVQTSLDWWLFVLAGISALIMAILTVSWHSWNTARKNPVEALRYE